MSNEQTQPGDVGAGQDSNGRASIPRGDTITVGAVDAGSAVAVGRGATANVTNITPDVTYDVSGLPNPYLGLRAFTYDDRNSFAGRKQQIEDTRDLLTEPSARQILSFITGASGSGKSSFAHAGLLPELEAYYTARHKQVHRATFRPSSNPVAGLRDALEQLGIAPSTPTDLAADLRATPADQINLLVIDQFEECFTQSEPTTRGELFNQLTHGPSFDETRTHILVTMRSDYLVDLFNVQPLWNIATRHPIEIRKMTVAELREAIQRPLQVARPQGDKRFEPALVTKLAEDAAQDASYLPLLQVTLEDIWNKGALKLSAYTNLTDAIKRRADAVLTFSDYHDSNPTHQRSPAEQAALMDILLELVDVPVSDLVERQDVRRRRPKSEVATSPEREHWIDELSAARLLSISTEAYGDKPLETVDLIHETLIRNWDSLQKAITERRRQLRRRTRFEQSLNEWKENGRADEFVLSGVWLAEARQLDDDHDVALRSEDAQSYLTRSIEVIKQAEAKQQQEQRRRRIISVSLLGALMVVVVAGFFAFVQSRISLARQLASQVSLQTSSEADTALLLALEAINAQIGDVAEARGSLLSALQCCPKQLVGFMRGHRDRVWSVAFSRDGNWLASAGDDAQIVIWDVSTRRVITTLVNPDSSASIYTVAFSPDGKWLASGDGDGAIILRAVADWQPVTPTLKAHTANVHSIAFSKSGKLLASGGADGKVIVWDVDARAVLTTFAGHTSWVWSVAFSPDEQTVASAGRDNAVRLWNLDPATAMLTTSMTMTAEHRGNTVVSLAFAVTKGITVLASADVAGRVVLWDMQPWQSSKERPTGKPFDRLVSNVVWGLSFSPDGALLATGTEGGYVKFWHLDVTQGITRATLSPASLSMGAHPRGVLRIAFSPDGQMLAAASADNVVSLWQSHEGQQTLRHPDDAQSVAFSADDHRLASTSRADATAHILPVDARNREVSPGVAITLPQVFSMTTLNLSGTLMAATGFDRNLYLWDMTSGQQLGVTLTGHLTTVRSLAFSPDGKWLASGDRLSRIILWDLSTYSQAAVIDSQHKGPVVSLAFTLNSALLASGGCSRLIVGPAETDCGRGEVRVWNVATRQQDGATLPAKSGYVMSLAFGRDKLAAGSADGAITAWDSRTRELQFSVTPYSSEVWAVAFSADGSLLASAGDQFKIILWDVASGTQFGRAYQEHDTRINALAFSHDDRWLASASDDNTVIVRDLDINSWKGRACQIANRNLTRDEWRRYLGGEPYRATCPEFPLEPN